MGLDSGSRRISARGEAGRELVAILFLVGLGKPAATQGLRDEVYRSSIQEGVDSLYRLDHDEAIQAFSELERRFPDHPGPPLSRAMAIWLRELFSRQELDLDRFISPGYFTRPSKKEMREEDQKAFYEDVAKAGELAEHYLDEHRGDKDARYYLGAVEGALGVFELTIERNYMKALKHGKRAFEYQKAIVEEDPDFCDAYMTVGTYEYIAGNLPWYVKWLAAIAGFRGSEERGFEYLIRAAADGLLVYNDARVLLMVLYVRESEYEYGLEMARQLHERYPENYLFHLNKAQILERMGDLGGAAQAYLSIVGLAEQARKNYQKVPLTTFRYTVGQKLVRLGDPREALAIFLAAAQDPETPPREKALSHLRAGEILESMGRREEAIAHYQAVQALQDFDGSHKSAGERLKRISR